jgi:hypothetical protein
MVRLRSAQQTSATQVAKPSHSAHTTVYPLRPPMARLFRGMQHVALVLPPLAMLLQLANSISVKEMLLLVLAAVCLFWIGRLLEGYAAR